VITLVLIGIVGGVITGVSPCVLPVLPVIFLTGGVPAGGRAQARRPYLIVAGLVASFALLTLLGTLVLTALHLPQGLTRWVGLGALVLLGVSMIVPQVQTVIERPFARIGQRPVNGQRGGFFLGLALGAVFVPCAGPVLAAITVAGATGRIGTRTIALTLAFAVGTAIPLLGFASAGRTVATRVRAFRERQRGFRVVTGLVVIGLAVGLTFNVTDVVQRSVPDYTAAATSSLNKSATSALDDIGPRTPIQDCQNMPAAQLQNCGPEPELAGISRWLNTPGDGPLTLAGLKGKVVLVDFWAYSCINCQRAIPHVEAWYQNYAADGLEVIGVHTPEYAFEHVASNVAAGAKRLHITYPVALDPAYGTWNNFDNDSWPADYLIDSDGTVRHVTIGEGDYAGTEALIRQLLTAAHPAETLPAATDLPDTTPDNPNQTPETYLGAERVDSFAQTEQGSLPEGTQTFRYPALLPTDLFALEGTWTVGDQSLTAGAGAGIELGYDASDVYLDVGGTGTITATVGGKVTTYQVSGAPDIYPVVSSPTPRTGTVKITLSPGLAAYSFTFG
jgi:cytochrome c biogenesis protein CcdA/thiol-disulfide isomerase/thioredoxin